MEIIELSKKLGEALRASEEFKTYQALREACRADHALKAKIDEFKIQKKIYDMEGEKDDRDEEMLGVIKKRMDELYEEVYATDLMKRFSVAEDNFNILLNAVNMTISSYITEQAASGTSAACTHDCASCAGCAEAQENA